MINVAAGSKDLLGTLMHISTRHPGERIVVWVGNGNVTVGFAKGPVGDKQEAEFNALVPSLEANPN